MEYPPRLARLLATTQPERTRTKMLNQCFNADCRKPLHYLREGRVFVFGVQESGDGESRLEHYWLCGLCAENFVLAQGVGGVHLVERKVRPQRVEMDLPGRRALAS